MQLDQRWLSQQGEDAALLHCIDTCFSPDLPARVGIAVSGGGDSVALLHLFARWSAQTGRPIAAVTVDHGLRAQSRAEAEGVAALCRTLGVPHDILTWHRLEGAGNLAAGARDARYALIADWALASRVGAVALGHTMDDGAENFLMRLGRAAGIDGLAGMQGRFSRHGLLWCRPLLQQMRATLREYLERHAVAWVEDPSNDDPKYMRTRARALLPQLGELGIDAQSLHHSAFALRQAQAALAEYTRREAAQHVRQEAGDIVLPDSLSRLVPVDIERRLTVAALQWVGSSPYPPRKLFAGVLPRDLMQQQRLTLSGCLIMKRKGHFRITREYNAVKDLVTPTDVVWDSRWRLQGPHEAGLALRALGEEGVQMLPDWRDTGLARPTLMASPAVWRGGTLVAAPVAGYNPDWSAQIVADFSSFLLSH